MIKVIKLFFFFLLPKDLVKPKYTQAFISCAVQARNCG